MAFLNFLKSSILRFLVKMSASCDSVGTWCRVTSPLLTCLQKWWYLTLICFVRRSIFGSLANSMAPLLSPNALHLTLGIAYMGNFIIFLISFTRQIKEIVSLRALDREIYSASVVLMAVSVYSLDCHITGHPAYIITNPVLDLAVLGSSSAVLAFHKPQKSASVCTSNWCLVGLIVIPSPAVLIKYWLMLWTASVYIVLELCKNCTTEWMDTANSGLLDFSR